MYYDLCACPVCYKTRQALLDYELRSATNSSTLLFPKYNPQVLSHFQDFTIISPRHIAQVFV